MEKHTYEHIASQDHVRIVEEMERHSVIGVYLSVTYFYPILYFLNFITPPNLLS